MKIVFCWPTISGYMAACWRELASRPGVELFVIGLQRAAGKHSDFDPAIMAGIPHRLLGGHERSSVRAIRDLVRVQEPDVLFLSGWQHRPYVPLAFDPALRRIRRFAIIDTPLKRGARQRVGKVALRPYFARMHGVFVPGERSWQYARWMGVPERRIHRGTYGVAWTQLSPLWDRRVAAAEGWPKAFLFSGQYVRRKGIDLLTDAYAQYRSRSSAPWPLVACGQGPERELLRESPGIVDRGFVQPSTMAEIRAETGVFVLPSRSDAWPLALVESCAAGLPVICSDACGSAVELVRAHHNGLTVPTGDSARLAQALLSMEHNHDRLADMGLASRDLAAAYSAERWADRILAACTDSLG